MDCICKKVKLCDAVCVLENSLVKLFVILGGLNQDSQNLLGQLMAADDLGAWWDFSDQNNEDGEYCSNK